jgi:replicative DNA helicase Mcm
MTHNPDEMLEAFNGAVLSILKEIHPDYAEEIQDKIRVRIGNYTVQKGLRDINADIIDKLIGVSGMVVRSSEVKPLAKKVCYRCLNCSTINEAQLKGLVLKRPPRCMSCSEKAPGTTRRSACRTASSLRGSHSNGRPCRPMPSW